MRSSSGNERVVDLSDLISDSATRILIVGSSCSGKSQLATALSKKVRIPRYDLDSLYWGRNWTQKPKTEFFEEVSGLAAKSEWIIDCVYAQSLEVLAPRATHILWLDLNFYYVLFRGIRRCLVRGIQREKLFHDNIETLSRSFLTTDSVIIPICRDFRKHRRAHRCLYHRYRQEKTIVRLKGNESLRVGLDNIRIGWRSPTI